MTCRTCLHGPEVSGLAASFPVPLKCTMEAYPTPANAPWRWPVIQPMDSCALHEAKDTEASDAD